VPKGVIKADLFSAMDSNGLSFSSYSKDDVLIAGYKPNDYSGIMISSSLANELFLGSDKALDESLSTLMLERTVKKGEDYLNYFSSGELKITGVIQNEKKVIYQDYLFPLSYAFSISSLQPNEIRATEAVLEVDLKKHNEDYYQRELNKIGDYQGSFPMLKMTEEIKKTLNQLSSLFLGFAFLSLISSAFLLGLSLFLIIRKEQKEIGILLSLGYYKKEIGFFFLVFSLLLGLIGFLLSLLLSLMTEKVLKSTLLDLLKDYQASLLPYLISFLTAFFLTALIGSIIRLKIAKIEPIDSFLK
jgi:ABC-type antimicrobial peptide transport system permease subunit